MKGKGSMKWPSLFACSLVTFLNICLSLIVYTNIGDDQCSGTSRIYVNFGLKDITASWLVASGTLSFCICIICTLPLYNFLLRRLVYDLFTDFMGGIFSQEFPSSQEMPLWFFIGFPGIFWFINLHLHYDSITNGYDFNGWMAKKIIWSNFLLLHRLYWISHWFVFCCKIILRFSNLVLSLL